MSSMRSHKDRLVRLREEMRDAMDMGIVDNKLWEQQMTQLLNSCESIKQKSQAEVGRLTELIGLCRGEQRAADKMADMLINTVAAYNSQNRKMQEEERRQDKERTERERATLEKEKADLEAEKAELERQKAAAEAIEAEESRQDERADPVPQEATEAAQRAGGSNGKATSSRKKGRPRKARKGVARPPSET